MKKLALFIASFIMLASMFMFARPASALIDTTPDCDTVAVIKCGVSSVTDIQNKAKVGDVSKIYSNFGIDQSELKGFVDGVVWKDGRVTLGTEGEGRLVATNAVTAGRWNNPTSDMVRIAGTDRAYRYSTSHFADEGQAAFIKIVNGKFAFAIVKPCGNPVTAKAVEPPSLSVVKDVKSRTRTTYGQTVTVKPGEEAIYRVTATNTGKTTLTGLMFRDVLPAGVTLRVGAVLNGQTITNNLGDGMRLPDLKPGQKLTLEYGAMTKASESRAAACTTGLTNRAYVKATDVPERSDTAVVKVCKPAAPVYTCNLIQGAAGDNRTFKIAKFNVTAQGGATFTRMSFDWGDGTKTSKKQNEIVNTTHQYAEDGTYAIKATAYFMIDGKEVSATGTKCAASVTFTAEEPPVVENPEAPEVPEELVDTGAGAIAGAVMSVVTASTFAYRFVWLRRLV